MKKINIIFAAILIIFLAVFIGQTDVKDIFSAKTSGENYTGNFKLEANRQIYQKFSFLSDDIENIQIGISDAKASSDALEGGGNPISLQKQRANGVSGKNRCQFG